MTFITRRAIPRRTVLRGMGVSLALPCLDSMVPAFGAQATTPGPVRRLGVVYVPNGMAMPRWTPVTTGEGEAAVQLDPLRLVLN